MKLENYLLPAMAGVMLLSFLMLMVQWRMLGRLRTHTRRDLARIFEQVDMLLLQPEAVPVIASAAAGNAAPDEYNTAQRLAAGGASQGEISARCGLSVAESRILVAMQALGRK
jgi:hypothetical protein